MATNLFSFLILIWIFSISFDSFVFANELNDTVEEKNLVAVYATPIGKYYGTVAMISVHGIPNIKLGQFSGAYIVVENAIDGAPNQTNAIVAGWLVQPNLFNDSLTHLFIAWTADAFTKTGCYNLFCPGFVSLPESIIKPGSIIQPISIEPKYNITLRMYKEKKSGNWWLSYGPSGEYYNLHRIGYWPSELFPRLADHANKIIWGGIVGYYDNNGEPGPPMGSGHLPKEGPGIAASFKGVKLVHPDATYYDAPGRLYFVQDKDICYKVGTFTMGSFLFGGPGGHC